MLCTYLHVSSCAQQKSKVNTQRPDVCAGLTRDPEDAEMPVLVILNELALVDGSYSELTLDC